eukprot:scaffold20516_cov181-Skeletonema_marinoi.AAC.1
MMLFYAKKSLARNRETPPFTIGPPHRGIQYHTSIVWSAATHVHCYGKLKTKLGSGKGMV